jgi:hypothetical protein
MDREDHLYTVDLKRSGSFVNGYPLHWMLMEVIEFINKMIVLKGSFSTVSGNK